jgi:hypothetical protein
MPYNISIENLTGRNQMKDLGVHRRITVIRTGLIDLIPLVPDGTWGSCEAKHYIHTCVSYEDVK